MKSSLLKQYMLLKQYRNSYNTQEYNCIKKLIKNELKRTLDKHTDIKEL